MNSRQAIDIVEVSNGIEKINMYIEEEQKLLLKIQNKINNLQKSYHSSKLEKFLNINQEINNNLDKIINKRTKYTKVLTKNVAVYENSALQTKNIFNTYSGGGM